jgi:hypothetical protein
MRSLTVHSLSYVTRVQNARMMSLGGHKAQMGTDSIQNFHRKVILKRKIIGDVIITLEFSRITITNWILLNLLKSAGNNVEKQAKSIQHYCHFHKATIDGVCLRNQICCKLVHTTRNIK